ncbi:MAG: ABC transporter ATP-binding protein [Candidatus Anammoxibacter sp.]
MIKVEHLSKRYTSVFAVDDISFEVPDGKILGFLGPNGAGKSTTMRILTCFMPATSGSAWVGGFDVFNDSAKVRQIIGYLPENVPLYTDMRVNEYLLFRSKIKNVARRERKVKISECVEKCGIVDVQNQIIGTLSKGYRQRVGLADTLIHDPKVLILDEPTIGLDPNQIRQVRGIIKELGAKHTVLLSTHILPEVEMLCDRVVIINKGKIAAEDSPKNLIEHAKFSGRLVLEVKGDCKRIKEALLTVDGVGKVEIDNKSGHVNTSNDEMNVFDVEVRRGVDAREMIFNVIVKNNFVLLEMKKKSASLEDIFHQITTTEDGKWGDAK